MTQPVFVPAGTADLPPDTTRLVHVAGQAILIVRSEGRYFAVGNLCSHAEEPLDCGRVKRGWIACPAHGARFDLATGEALGPPAAAPIATFAVRIVDDRIEVATGDIA